MPTHNFNAQYFPDYEILSKLGQSNAHVCKARHKETGEIVAIKHFPFNIDEGTLRRFRRESDLMTSLDHPNIVGIRAYHLDAELPYLVMEWVEGGDLRGLLSTGSMLPLPEVLRLGLQITEALRIIHLSEIIHRDIKPENILYRRLRSGENQYLLTDFGISRLKGQGRSTGIASMTYEYASPESFYDEDNLNESSDYYSFGVVLFECITGRVPFALGSKGIGALMESVKNAPLPPMEGNNQEVLSPSLHDLIQLMLEKNPEKRLFDNTLLKRKLKRADLEWEEGVTGERLISEPGSIKTQKFKKDSNRSIEELNAFNLAEKYVQKQDFEQAIPILVKLAQNGNANASNSLGKMYQKGLGVEKDLKIAFGYYLQAAKLGNALGQSNLGYLYQHGLGIGQSHSLAFDWYKKAAEQGNDTAQVNVGFLYFHGLGTKKSPASAVKWYREAAQKGNAWGYYNLGVMYEKGQGVERSLSEAKRLYKLAKVKGLDAAKAALNRIENVNN